MIPSIFKTVTKSQDCPTGHLLLDDYGVMKLLGEGGMGQVYLVRSVSTGAHFAVKRTKLLSDSDRKRFLAELQTWIDLPDHPNLVACRFFRTLAGEVLIFAEYVAGGSLKDWIESGKLYEGGHDRAIERMLDIAIQLATGLDFVHQLGLVHQDIKPGNILMTSDCLTGAQGVVTKITDFGLSRARAATGPDFSVHSYDSLLVSSICGTPAYWSPEQSKGMPMTHKADIWSWAVSVMELFTGGVTWLSGLGAAEVLDQYLQECEHDETIPIMPSSIAELLRECFCQDPQERPASLAATADKLRKIYLNCVGLVYDRTQHAIERSFSFQPEIYEHRTRTNEKWDDPEEWLVEALSADGRDSSETTSKVAKRGATRAGSLVAEVAIYDEAKGIFEELIRGGNNDLKPRLAKLCKNKSLVHQAAGDVHGAIMEYDRAIELLKNCAEELDDVNMALSLVNAYACKAEVLNDYTGDHLLAYDSYNRATSALEILVNEYGENDLGNNLASHYSSMANSARLLGNSKEAVEIYTKAQVILERLVNRGGRSDLVVSLARTYLNKSNAISSLGDMAGAITLCDESIIIFEQKINLEGRVGLEDELAHVYVIKANYIIETGDHQGAMFLYDMALAIREKLVNKDDRNELKDSLAWIYDRKADAASQLGDKTGALELFDKAIAIREHLVIQQGRKELANGLAVSYTNKANLINNLGDSDEAIRLYDKAMAIQRRLIDEGRFGIKNDLALNYVNKADAIGDSGNQLRVIAFYNAAILLQEELFEKVPSIEYARNLIDSYSTKAERFSRLEKHEKSIPFYDKAIVILERLIEQTQISEVYLEFASDLARIYTNKGMILNVLDDGYEAIVLHEKAIVIQERLVNQHGLTDISGDLARSKGYHGMMLLNHGEVEQVEQAMAELEFSMKILHDEFTRTGRVDLKEAFDWLAYNFSEFINGGD